MKISRVAIIGLGLIGGSVGLSVREMLPNVATTGWDADADVRARAAEGVAAYGQGQELALLAALMRGVDTGG